MQFEYLKHTEYQDSLDIEDMGNVILDVFNDEGQEWLLSIQTELGYTKIITCGPFIADINSIGNFFNFNYLNIDYSEKLLYKTINNFINDDKKVITQIFFISAEEFSQKLKNIEEFKINYEKS